jgi:phosphoribosylformimino-5-aminoimidazole carboxamide ribotide isomerase
VIAYAALDLRGGRVVQLVGGRPDQERVSLPDPLAVARHWVAAGFTALHVIDLDAALSHGDNLAVIEEVIRAAGVPVQVGGGVRDETRADQLLDNGAERVIVGTRAIEEPEWLAEFTQARPRRIIVAVDVRDGAVLTRGWTEAATVRIRDVLAALDALPLAGILVTDVTREGRMTGVHAPAFAEVARATRHPLIAAGGIGALEDLRALEAAGAAGAVLGMALYTGAIDGGAAAREFRT